MASTLDDIHDAVRMWRRHPGFVAAAMLTLGLGLGANTMMFSVVNATLLRELPVPDPDRLMTIWRVRLPDRESLNRLLPPEGRSHRAGCVFRRQPE